MGGSDVREHEARSHGAGPSPVFDLVASKLRRPLVRRGTVHRSILIERLRRDDRCPIVSVVAPPGYGKTTVLAQWAERNGQSFAWVSVDERDNDPKVLLTYVAEALNRVEPGLRGRRSRHAAGARRIACFVAEPSQERRSGGRVAPVPDSRSEAHRCLADDPGRPPPKCSRRSWGMPAISTTPDHAERRCAAKMRLA
jgi:hypothetical protein